MSYNQPTTIKRAQKESLLLQELSKLLLSISRDDNKLQGLSINRVKVSSDKSVCTVFFYALGGLPDFQEKLKTLVLYKPSLRKAIGTAVPSRYVPELVFKFDDQFEKQQRIDEILEKIKEE